MKNYNYLTVVFLHALVKLQFLSMSDQPHIIYVVADGEFGHMVK